MHSAELATYNRFLSHDLSFYKQFFGILLFVALQNLLAYSVNIADNIMLGNYSQEALSGASTVNQIFFLVQAYAIAMGTALTTLSSQYWGKKNADSVRVLTGITMRLGLISGLLILLICSFFSRPILLIFTSSETILQQGQLYLSIVQWSFLLFILSNILTSTLRSIGTVNISLWISLVTGTSKNCVFPWRS